MTNATPLEEKIRNAEGYIARPLQDRAAIDASIRNYQEYVEKWKKELSKVIRRNGTKEEV